jgi:MoaA/NifB/PqqE/SkfB family radical SAM enzyme
MLLSHLFSRSLPHLDWIQVEVTSHCNAACVYCPFTVYRKHWQGRHMRIETFEKILPFCSTGSMIHLQGWGEPFLNPDFFKMIAMAKKQGYRVGTTTNGTLTDRDCLAKMVDLGVDVIAFSLAATDSSNDDIRKGTRLQQVLTSITRLSSLKHNQQVSKPEIHIAYMLLKPGLANIKKLPALIQDLDISQTVISTLDFIADERLARASFLSNHQTLEDLQTQLNSVVADGRSRGVDIHYQIPGKEQQLFCSENVLNSLVVSSDGTVSPCVFTNMPLPVDHGSQKGPMESYIPLHLGNIHSLPLNRIWWQKQSRSMRSSFARNQHLRPCIKCPKRHTLTDQTLPASSVKDLMGVLD